MQKHHQHLKDNEFSSYGYMAKKYGNKEMQGLVRSVIDVDEDKRGLVDMKGLSEVDVK